MKDDLTVRTYRVEDLPALVDLTNAADAFDGLERGTTLEELEHEMTWPGYQPEADCFLAWDGDRLVGYSDLFARKGSDGKESIYHSWGLVHPAWRRRGVGRTLLAVTLQRASERLAEVDAGPVYFQANAHRVEEDRRALYQRFGMVPARHFVNLARPIDNGLPPQTPPAGYRLRPMDLERDLETAWRVDDEAFSDHWGFPGFSLDEFRHWIERPCFRADLLFLAETEAAGEVVGLALNQIDADWIERTGRQEGFVNTLGVLREHRRQGLGTALLAHSLHALRGAGMEAAHLWSDSENLTGAVRLYERLGFQVRKNVIAYRKVMRDG